MESQNRIGSLLDRMSPAAPLTLAAALFLAAVPTEAADTVRIYRSTMPDGSVMLSDKPSSGARAVASDTYVLKAPAGAADAERDYWRRQSEAFNLRQQQRDLEAARSSMGARRVRGRDREGDHQAQYYRHASPYAFTPLVPQQRMHYRRTHGLGSDAGRGHRGGSTGSGSSYSRQDNTGPDFSR